MPQIFHRSTNYLSRISIWGAVFILAGAGWVAAALSRSSYATRQGIAIWQPVPFSHEHHVGGLGIDCRYCHTAVETSSAAGMPPTATCINCHKLIWKDSPTLEPVRESFRTGQPIRWTRVHDLPDYARFDHSIHVAKGVGCASCHGRIDRMELTHQEASLHMEWCLECHRSPEKVLRPRDEVFNMDWEAEDQAALGAALAREYGLRSAFALTNCSTCHH
jgi:hypothetical protein